MSTATSSGSSASSKGSSSSSSSWTTWTVWTASAFRMTTVTDLLDKILTSTVRLLAIANWLLAVTYQVHTAVAVWFLGGNGNSGNDTNSRTGGRRRTQHGDNAAAAAGAGGENNQHRNNNQNNNNNMAAPQPQPTLPNNNNARTERLGGFLLFKLLLISAVVAPDTLDLLILLSWYTLLSFLRSLALLCAGRTELTVQAGHAPVPGVLHLLVAVLVTDCIAAAVCVALFHGAGWGMVVLLTTDCVQLAVDCVVFILQHATVVLEAQHVAAVQVVEDARLTLLQQYQRQQQQNASTTGTANGLQHDNERREERTSLREHPDNDETLHRPDTRRLELRVEVLEKLHARRSAIFDTTIFGLQLLTHALTVGHFLHIWSLHGVQFTLIDGVLALHLHSALSSACKKIAERRNLHRIARDLDGMFEDASELDLRKASATGDVCCICLGTMSTGTVKKVGCGHLYHTACLREVVERARSIEAARCPLCRASVLDGRQQGIIGRNENTNGNNENAMNRTAVADADAGNNANVDNEQGRRNNIVPQVRDVPNTNQGGGGEHALFRFSTENIFPAWLPLPAFSFEVVRRPPNLPEPVGVNHINMNNNNDTGNAVAVDNENENDANNNPAQENIPAAARPHQQQQQQPSLIRRLLVLAGAIPMSPEEEAAALEQLVDMFPQYDRADLLRGLRERGSAEGVAEDVLSGGFAAIPRGAVNWPGPPMDR
jgi:hypothetical protein